MNMTDDGWIKKGSYDDDTPTWDKEKEKTVSGILVAIQNNAGKEKNSTIYTLKKSDGEKVNVWGGLVIDGRLADVVIGEEVRIDFLGKVKGNSGRTYNNFEVYTRPVQTEESDKKSENEDDLPF